MKIRVFALAKELGIDSKDLIQYCNDVGIMVKTSALASITPEERDRVIAHYEAVKSAGGSSASSVEPPQPVRDESAVEKIGKVRTIQPRLTRSKPKADDAPPETTVPAPASAPDEDVVETVAAETPPGVEESVEEKAPETKRVSRVQPMKRDDYATPSRSMIREMKPIGSVSETEAPRAKPTKQRPQVPSIAAAPELKLQRTKVKKEETAQKPDIRLTSDFLEQQSPLGEQLRKNAEKKAKRDDREPETAEEAAARKGRSLIEERRRASKRLLTAQPGEDEESKSRMRMKTLRRRKRSGQSAVPLKTEATIELPITLRGLSDALGRPVRELMKILMQQGEMVTINQLIDEDVVLMLAMECGVDLTIEKEQQDDEFLDELYQTEDSEELQSDRPPIVTILGHVDHGKTTLLDKIRAANVAAGEAGGITQHIAAYQVEHQGKKITFVDTPGHAAFGEMRARGANVTDIIVLVVAADDGVMPQTVECISHAKAAGVPIIVALNKIDLPEVNEQRALQGLAQYEILPAEWGGDVEVVRTSGATGTGLDKLLETILLTAELQEFKASPKRNAVGVCLEAFRDEGRGPVAWLMVKNGTLRVGDPVLCGSATGRIRAIYNDRDEELPEAPPSTPVKVAGLDRVPNAGERFFVLDDVERLREIADQRGDQDRASALGGRKKTVSLEDILVAARSGQVQDLPLIVKADTPGSLEALRGEITKFEHPEVRVRILHEGVGGVNESDIYLASATGAIIIAFHVIAEDRAQTLAEAELVEIRRYTIIYEVTRDIRDALEGMLAPERIEVSMGRALVLRTFSISRVGTIAGCRVLNGTIDRGCRVHVIRDQTIINDYAIASLRRDKDDVKEVREGMECGIRLEGFNDVKEGDLLEAFRFEEKKRSLDQAVAST